MKAAEKQSTLRASNAGPNALRAIAQLLSLSRRRAAKPYFDVLEKQIGGSLEDLYIDRRSIRWESQRDGVKPEDRYLCEWENHTQVSLSINEIVKLTKRSWQTINVRLKQQGEVSYQLPHIQCPNSYQHRTLTIYARN